MPPPFLVFWCFLGHSERPVPVLVGEAQGVQTVETSPGDFFFRRIKRFLKQRVWFQKGRLLRMKFTVIFG